MTRQYDAHLLGRNPMLFDIRRHKYLMSHYLSADDWQRASEIMVKEWIIDYLLDQGDTPHCVGFAWAHHAITRDEDLGTWALMQQHAHELYYKACAIGGYPNTENGSSTQDGAEAARQLGYVRNYSWADNAETLKTWLLVKGSVVTGVPWYSDMFRPDTDGLIHATGTIEGGHEIEINRIDLNRGRLRIPNSWGVAWGDNGFCEVTLDDYFGKLLSPMGDAATAVDNPPGTPPIPPVPPDPVPGCRQQALDFIIPRAYQNIVRYYFGDWT